MEGMLNYSVPCSCS